ncbi:hypothetical protein ACHAWC_006838 [Mediolabrus comicus]
MRITKNLVVTTSLHHRINAPFQDTEILKRLHLEVEVECLSMLRQIYVVNWQVQMFF